jgi:hypothetical protein
MTGDQFRKIWRKRPFIPCFIRTASGESYAVNHPELAWIPPESDLVLVMVAGDVVMIEVDSITEVVIATSKRKAET